MTFEQAIIEYFKAKEAIRVTLDSTRYDADEMRELENILKQMEDSETTYRDVPTSIAYINELTNDARAEIIRMFHNVA